MTDASVGSSNREQLGEAWNTFTDQLKALGHEALDSSPNDAERLDGLRFILRQLAYREEQFLEFPGGSKPELFWAESPTRKVFADCPDTIYYQFSVARGGRYRITGTRGESPYISFTAYRAGIVDRVVDDLHDGEIAVGADGTFTLDVGGPDPEANWLDLGDDAAFVIIREYTHDRVNGVKATFEVEQLDPVLTQRAELSVEQMTSVLALLGMGLTFVNNATVNLSEELRLRPNIMNEAGAELVSEMAGTPHNHYQLCYVKLEPGQAVEVELNPPACRYWSVHLNNWWLESPEFRDDPAGPLPPPRERASPNRHKRHHNLRSSRRRPADPNVRFPPDRRVSVHQAWRMDRPAYTLRPITSTEADQLRQKGGPIYVADEHPGYPCRQCLLDAEIGDELILVSHDPFTSDSPYRSASPIFLHRSPCTPATDADDRDLPLQLTRRQLSVRSFDESEMMIDAAVIDGSALEATLLRMFDDLSTNRVHVHNATRGCWAVTVERE